MDYLTLKTLHITLALVSVLGFAVRWAWMMMDSPLDQHWIAKRAPHVLDTLFLGTGIWLAVMLSASPMAQPWLMAKILGLIGYVILAWLAYKSSLRKTNRTVLFLSALSVFAWVISVAQTREVSGFFGTI